MRQKKKKTLRGHMSGSKVTFSVLRGIDRLITVVFSPSSSHFLEGILFCGIYLFFIKKRYITHFRKYQTHFIPLLTLLSFHAYHI